MINTNSLADLLVINSGYLSEDEIKQKLDKLALSAMKEGASKAATLLKERHIKRLFTDPSDITSMSEQWTVKDL